MKDKLTKLIREVSIADKTYPEYIEAVADKLIASGVITTTRYWVTPDGILEMIPTVESVRAELAREIFGKIGELINEYLDGRSYRHEFLTKIAELKKKYTQDKGRDKIAEFGKYSPLSWRNTEDGK